MNNDEICYGFDAFNQKILRFVSPYQRRLWIENGHPEFPEDRQSLCDDHHLVKPPWVNKWVLNEQGFEEGHP